MNKTKLLLFLILFPAIANSKTDGVIIFDVGIDSFSGHSIAVLRQVGYSSVYAISIYYPYSHADIMPRPLRKDSSSHTWSYRCLDEQEDKWLLQDESESGKSYWVFKNSWLTFKTYQDWWLTVDGIIPTENIYVNASKKSSVVARDSICQVYKVVEVRENWLRINYSRMHCTNASDKSVGWILWRRKNEILVSFQ